MMTTMLRGLGVGVGRGCELEGEEGDDVPEPQAGWMSRAAARKNRTLVLLNRIDTCGHPRHLGKN
jgi:hypothetical protein